VFCAAYRLEGDNPVPLVGAQLRALQEWLDEVENLATGHERIIFIGDGADVHWETVLQRFGPRAHRPPVGLRTLRSAAGAARGAMRLRRGRREGRASSVPWYLGAPEGERKWAAKHRSPS